MPEGLRKLAEFSCSANTSTSPRDLCAARDGAGPPSDFLTRVEGEIRGLEQEIAFLDALCRSYEQCFTSSDD
jgi:hypothetical protein